MPSVNDACQQQLIKEIIQYCDDLGYETAEGTYHDCLPEWKADILISHTNYTSMKIRTGPDLVAFHRDIDHTFYVDGKTSSWRHGQDFAIECLPLMSAIHDSMFHQTDYVFACRRKDESGEYGITASQSLVNHIKCIKFPPKWQQSPDLNRTKRKWKRQWKAMFNLCSTQRVPPFDDALTTVGSQDPFAVIKSDSLEYFPTWKVAIRKIYENAA